MKKNFSIIFVLLACIMLIGCFFGFKKIDLLADTIEVETKSKAIYLIEPNSKSVIYSKNENKRLPIASMCKIMTLLLTFEAIDNGEFNYSDKIIVSDSASSMGGSQVFLESNGEYLVGDLIKSIVVSSANDACVAMAEKICGSEGAFVEKMNLRAKELEMNDTVFVNCTGLPKPGQYSSAKDVATMFSQLIKHEEYFRFSRIWTDKIIHPKDRVTEITNTNKLIRFYQGCLGGKTGYTSESGHCLAAVAKRGETTLISVAICSPDSKTRFNEVSSLFNYGFANYENKMVINKDKPLEIEVSVSGGKKDKVEVVAKESFYLFSKKGEKRSIELSFLPNVKIKAPIKTGDVVGILSLYENEILIKEIEVISNEDILSKSYFDSICDALKNWSIA